MSGSIAGKVVVITGASSGIGEAAAKRLAADGAVHLCRASLGEWAGMVEPPTRSK